MKPSILIADDHPLVLKGLQDFLIEKDSNIAAVAKNGKEALSLIKALQPDIAILDIQMPFYTCLIYTSPSPRDQRGSRMPSSA